MNAERVLVTGAGGFVGRWAVEQLVADGFEVHAVSSGRGEPAHEGAAAHDGVVTHTADLFDAASVARLCEHVRAAKLLHLAWYAVPGRFWSAAENVDWIDATLRLLERFAASGGVRAVCAGTCAEYEWGAALLRERDTPLLPATLYGACKHATHVVAEALGAQLGFELAWGRIFFLYGPGEDPQRLVASVAHGLLAGERVPTTDGNQVRDFLHVADVAGALVALLGSDVRGPVNIASGEAVEVRHVVTAIGAAVGKLDLVDFGALPQREGDPPRIVADVGRLRDEVGFSPRYGLADGIADAVRWWRNAAR